MVYGLWSISLFIVALILTGCGKEVTEIKEETTVSAVKVERGAIKENLFYIGDIKAKDEAVVYPKVTGKIIEKFVKEGDRIEKGDVLTYIDRDEVGFQFEKAPVESPIDGVVGTVYVDKGENVSQQTPIALVMDMDTVKVEVHVIEIDLPKIKEGQAAEIIVDPYPEEVFGGVIEKVSPVVDLASRTSTIEIIIPNPDHRLKPGMFARIKMLVGEREDVLLITRDAIVKENSSRYVFVVDEGGKVSRRKIEVGISENNTFEVISGLNEGDVVVTMGNTRLEDGDIVEIIER